MLQLMFRHIIQYYYTWLSNDLKKMIVYFSSICALTFNIF